MIKDLADRTGFSVEDLRAISERIKNLEDQMKYDAEQYLNTQNRFGDQVKEFRETAIDPINGQIKGLFKC